MIRHFVALRFNNSTSDEKKQELYDALRGLSAYIEGIVDFQCRANISIEDQLVRGYRDIFWFDFRNIAARDAYLLDARHKAIGARLLAELNGGGDGLYVFDFEI